MSDNTLMVYGKVQDPLKFSTDMANAIGALVGAQSETQGQAVALQCLCEGITPIDFARKYHLIQGKPCMKPQAMLAEFRMNWGGKYEIKTHTDKVVEIDFTDASGKIYQQKMTRTNLMLSRFVWERAPGWQKCVAQVRSLMAAGKSEDEIWLTMLPHMKDNYGTETDWKNMMFNRLVGDSLRAICPEMAAGVYTPEEMVDAIDGEIVHEKPAPPTASEFIKQAQATSAVAAVSPVKPVEEPPFETAAEGEVIEAEYELGGHPEPPGPLPESTRRLVAKCIDQFKQAFGDKSDRALANALADPQRNVKSLTQLTDEQLQVISDRLTAKIAQLAPKN